MARVKREIHLCTKSINDIVFTSHDYKGGKYLITTIPVSGERWVGYEFITILKGVKNWIQY
ncbi:MAG: hypothetical protein IJD46_03915 [Bacilli bacterium]|nr:hypothetical protein [Bacilli bacterium]